MTKLCWQKMRYSARHEEGTSLRRLRRERGVICLQAMRAPDAGMFAERDSSSPRAEMRFVCNATAASEFSYVNGKAT